MKFSRRTWVLSAASLTASVLLVGAWSLTTGLFTFGGPAATAMSAVSTANGRPHVRRLTQDQYRNTIADIFGTDITIAGHFDPEQRVHDMLAIGTSDSSITPASLEQFEKMAWGIASQVVDEKHRDVLLPCKPTDAATHDSACAQEIIDKYGRLLLRQSLSAEQTKRFLALASTGPDFYTGIESSLAAMMSSSRFLFRVENLEPVGAGQVRLDRYAKAERLSFLLWNSTPDDELLTAAEKGDLDNNERRTRQVDRLLANEPRLERSVRALFSDMFGFDGFDELTKDPKIYPVFGSKAAADSEEEELRTIVDLLLTDNGDYRDLFTTRKTEVSRPLGLIYQVPVAKRNGFEPAEFDSQEEGEDLRAGILSRAGFLALYSHPGRSSPTRRGKAIRELVLCQRIPPPPPNVDFSVVQDTNNPKLKTARDRLTAHRTNPTCAGCHRLTDPIGLALENFDGAGMYRADENQVPIDTSGDLDGHVFKDAIGLGQAIHDHPATPACLVRRVYETGVGRPLGTSDREAFADIGKDFATSGYKLRALLRRVAVADALYRPYSGDIQG